MDEKEKLRAVMDCDPSFDGRFYYGVRSTGIYCRPSCKSKKPLPENILYFDTRFQAEAANFRPCKRCRPDLLGYDPDAETAERAKGLICLYYADAEALRGALSSIGLGRSRLTRIFEQRFGMSIKQYTDSVRLGKAKSLLEGGSSATDAALEIGFGSSAFSAFFKNHTGMSPAEYAACSPGAGHSCVMETPAGCLRITEGPQGVTSIAFVNQEPYSFGQGTYIPQAKRELDEYFSGRRREFTFPLDLRGSAFQRRVWEELRRIPYGETRCYQEIALAIGNDRAARSVGMASNRNPALIAIPCHRVVGKNGSLVGYAGGIERKAMLLRMEKESLR